MGPKKTRGLCSSLRVWVREREDSMRNNTIVVVFLIGSAALAAWNLYSSGTAVVLEGLVGAGRTLLSVFPLLVGAFLVAGMIQVLVPRDLVQRFLGEEARLKGLVLGSVAGALVPGGPYVYYPIAVSFLRSGASMGTIIAFITAKNLWSVSRLPMEVALLGPELTVIRFGVTFLFPPLLGLMASLLLKDYADVLRGEVGEE